MVLLTRLVHTLYNRQTRQQCVPASPSSLPSTALRPRMGCRMMVMKNGQHTGLHG